MKEEAGDEESDDYKIMDRPLLDAGFSPVRVGAATATRLEEADLRSGLRRLPAGRLRVRPDRAGYRGKVGRARGQGVAEQSRARTRELRSDRLPLSARRRQRRNAQGRNSVSAGETGLGSR